MSQGKILVTGGAGFIGSHLVDRLVREGFSVRILDNLSKPTHDGIPSHLSREAEFLRGDVSNPQDVDKALEGVSAVFHQAAIGGFTQDIAPVIRSNAYGTAVLLERIKCHGRVEKIVVASSVAVYGEGCYRCRVHGPVYPGLRDCSALSDGLWEQTCPSCGEPVAHARTPESKAVSPETIYSITKYDQERMVLSKGREWGLPCVALRYFLTYGPRQSLRNPYTGICSIFTSQIANGKAPRIFEDGRQVRNFVNVRDVVAANLLVYRDARANGKVFNVGTGQAISIMTVATLLGHFLDKEIPPLVEGEFRLGEVRHLVSDISGIESLGFRPAVSLQDGLREYIAWISTQGNITDYFSSVYESLRDDRVIRRACLQRVTR